MRKTGPVKKAICILLAILISSPLLFGASKHKVPHKTQHKKLEAKVDSLDAKHLEMLKNLKSLEKKLKSFNDLSKSVGKLQKELNRLKRTCISRNNIHFMGVAIEPLIAKRNIGKHSKPVYGKELKINKQGVIYTNGKVKVTIGQKTYHGWRAMAALCRNAYGKRAYMCTSHDTVKILQNGSLNRTKYSPSVGKSFWVSGGHDIYKGSNGSHYYNYSCAGWSSKHKAYQGLVARIVGKSVYLTNKSCVEKKPIACCI